LHGADGQRGLLQLKPDPLDGTRLDIRRFMSDPIEVLILDLLESLASEPRTYSEVMEAWRTSCPRLPVWEEANDRGYIRKHGSLVSVTPIGLEHLVKRRGV
jgi:hypothetical protein